MRKSVNRLTAASAFLLLGTVPGLGWSCSSEEELAAKVSADERSRISAEVAAERSVAQCSTDAKTGETVCKAAAGQSDE